jgi:multidrug efflux pump subunit AcrB
MRAIGMAGRLAPAAGGSLWASLATSIIAGMLVSTLSTLFVIPCMYYVIYREKAV